MLSKGKRKGRGVEEEREVEEEEEIFKRSRKGIRKDIGEDIKKVGKDVEEGREELIRQLSELRESWERERAELLEKVEVLERKVERLELEKKEEKGVEGNEEGRREIDRRVRELEIRIDKKEREERRRNIIIKRVKVEGNEDKKAVEQIWAGLGIKEKVEEVRRVGRVDGEGRSMVLVRMEGMEGKREVMKAKRELKGRPERVEDDLTVEERRAKWKIEREAERERRKGNRVQIGYMKMWVNNEMRKWDEIEEKWIKVQEQGNGQRGIRNREERSGNSQKEGQKERVFWEGIKGWDVVIMCETWIGRKEWEGVRGRATGGYVWDIQYAERRGKKGRAMGGMIIGVREGIRMEKDEKERGEEGIIARKIWLGKDAWKIVGVYVNKDLERKLGMLREWMEEKERGVRIIIGGDFNARTGSQGGRIQKGGKERKRPGDLRTKK
ncbi:hypothetical protein ANTPLA_LOCUS8955 [Anthophora plagiata]